MSGPVPHEFTVEDTLNVTGRGLVVIGGGSSGLPVGCPLPAGILTPDGRLLRRHASRELLLIRTTLPVERDAFVLVGTTREEVPVGSAVRVFPPSSDPG